MPKLGRLKFPLLSLLSGALYPFAFAPINMWPLVLVSLASFFILLQQVNRKQALWCGFCYGLGLFAVGVSWVFVSIHVYGNSPIPIAALFSAMFVCYLATFFLLFAAGYKWCQERLSWLGTALAVPSWWLGIEWLRGTLFTGFPWLLLGYSQLPAPLAGFAPVVGVYGVSWLTVLLVMLLLPWLQIRQYDRRLRGGALVVALVLLLGGAELKQVAWTQPNGEPKTVALVQGNIPQDLRWLASNQEQIIKTYWQLSEDWWSQDIIIWPESAISLPMPYASPILDGLTVTAKDSKTALILGIPEQAKTDSGRYYNTLQAIGHQARGDYAKRHLVPFGEYLPLESWLRGIIAFFDLPMSGFIPGAEKQPLLEANGLRLQAAICYEIAYPGLVYSDVEDAGAILTVSNDTWFGDSFGPSQHLQMAQFRALETGRPVLRATNNGITAIINQHGELVKTAPSFERAVLQGVVQPYRGVTPLVWLVGALGA